MVRKLFKLITMLKEIPYKVAKNDEIWLNDDEMIIIYHPKNYSLHFLDINTYYKIYPSKICKNKEHAIKVFKQLK